VETTSYDMSDLLGMARRHWWLVLALTLLGITGAYQYTQGQPRIYESATSVLVEPTGAGGDTNVSGGRTKGDINLDTEAQLVRSTAVAADAAQLLQSAAAPDALAVHVRVEVPANTSVLVIAYQAGEAKLAQAGSHAFAEAYLRNRQETAQGDLAAQIATVDGKLKQLNAALAPINARLATLRGDSPERPSLESQRTTLTSQVNTLSARLNQLTTTTVGAGKIIRDAKLPARPTKPVLPLNLGTGAAIGLLFGAAGALLRERLDRRLRRPADLTRRCDVPLLATLPPRVRPRLDDVFPPFGAGGRVFNRLRNEVVASAPAPATPDPRGQVIVVAGASRGSASTVVAANLAAAFARTGGRTILVCAHLSDSVAEVAPVTALLGVRATPGLSEVLAGRAQLPRAVQQAPRQPRLSVITTGGTASAGGLLQSQTLRDTLTALRRQAEYVVIEAPAMSTSADAQSVASLADIALVAVELRRTRYTDVSDAAEQLRRVGTPLLGAVVLPKLSRRRGEEPAAGPAVAVEADENATSVLADPPETDAEVGVGIDDVEEFDDGFDGDDEDEDAGLGAGGYRPVSRRDPHDFDTLAMPLVTPSVPIGSGSSAANSTRLDLTTDTTMLSLTGIDLNGIQRRKPAALRIDPLSAIGRPAVPVSIIKQGSDPAREPAPAGLDTAADDADHSDSER
jgi:Mrp family chromosome partitioning ATPase/capsular polysaccharide biosynthesis protein